MISVRKVRTFINNYNIFNYAAQLSYGLMLAFLPLVMLLNWALRVLFTNEDLAGQVTDFINTYLPQQFSDLIVPSLNNTVANIPPSFSALIGNIALLVFLLLAVLRLMRLIIQVVTKICGMEEDRSFIKIWLMAIGNLFILLIVLALAIFIYIESRFYIVDTFEKFATDPAAKAYIEWVWDKLITAAFVVISILPLNWILAKAPPKPLKFTQALPGTAVILIGWVTLFIAMRFFNSFLRYEGVLQIIDSGINILIDIYMISFIFLLGVIVNYRLSQRRQSKIKTVNPIEVSP